MRPADEYAAKAEECMARFDARPKGAPLFTPIPLSEALVWATLAQAAATREVPS